MNNSIQKPNISVPGISGAKPSDYIAKKDTGFVVSQRTWGERAVASLPNWLKHGALQKLLEFFGGPSGEEVKARNKALEAFQELFKNDAHVRFDFMPGAISVADYKSIAIIAINEKITPDMCNKLQQRYEAIQAEAAASTTPKDSVMVAGVIPRGSNLGVDLDRLRLDIAGKHFDYGSGAETEDGQSADSDLEARGKAILDLVRGICVANVPDGDDQGSVVDDQVTQWMASLSSLLGQALVLRLNGLNNEGLGLLPEGLNIMGQGGNDSMPKIKLEAITLDDGTQAMKVLATTQTSTVNIIQVGEVVHMLDRPSPDSLSPVRTSFGELDYGVELICYPPRNGGEPEFKVIGGYTQANLRLPNA
ncbi:MAG TPA: hypothetical protein PLV25_06630 [Opitutales bacterium]|nr:hypothetical protein [Opitutales bacterium]